MFWFDLLERLKDMLLRPGETWPDVREESVTVRQLYASYAAILAAIPAIAHFIGMAVVGIFFLGIRYRAPFSGAFGYVVCSYVLSLGGLYVYALMIDTLAPAFGSKKGFMNALKLAVYSSTPAWVAGVLLLVPAFAPFALLLSFYGFYLLYLGLSPLMGTPERNRIIYLAVLIIAGLLISIVVSLIASFMFPTGRMGII